MALMLSNCPTCDRRTLVDVEGPVISYGCHSFTVEELQRLVYLPRDDRAASDERQANG